MHTLKIKRSPCKCFAVGRYSKEEQGCFSSKIQVRQPRKDTKDYIYRMMKTKYNLVTLRSGGSSGYFSV